MRKMCFKILLLKEVFTIILFFSPAFCGVYEVIKYSEKKRELLRRNIKLVFRTK